MVVSWNGIDAAIDREPALLLMAREDRLVPRTDPTKIWMSQSVASKIECYVHAGGGLFAWHSGLASYPASGTYYQVLGEFS